MARPDLRRRARTALAERLQERVPAAALHAGGEHALRFADALVPTLDAADVAWAHGELAARAKGELRPARSGSVGAQAAWSSTALVCSAFAPWRERPGELPLAGLGPFTGLRLEERLPIPHGGGTPNLDVALDAPGGLTGVESKLTEHLAPARPRPWRPAYRRPAMAAALDAAWGALLQDLRDGTWVPLHLDAGQLVRHALSLRGAGDLLLAYWEPENAAEHPEVAAHRAEVQEALQRLEGASPRLHALPWSALWDAWAPVLPAHVAALRARYAVDVPA
jgi:hypothetical protein